MAELEEGLEIFEDAEEGIDGEAEGDDVPEEEKEEFDEEAKKAKEEVGKLRSVVDYFKSISWPQVLKKFAVFVVKQLAIGAILFGVNLALTKLVMGKKDTAQNKTRKAKVAALSKLLKDLSDKSKELSDWLKKHEKERVTLDGIEIPLPDIFTKYTASIEQYLSAAFKVAKQLTKKDGSGKTTFVIPDTGQVNAMIDSAAGFISSFQGFVTFAGEKQSEFPVLKDLPLSQKDVDQLKADLETVKQLPYA